MHFKLFLFIILFFSGISFANSTTEGFDAKKLLNEMIKVDNATLEELKVISSDINDRVNNRINKIASEATYTNIIPNNKDKNNISKPSRAFFVFISSSIPMDTLRHYAQTAPSGTVFLLKGVVGDDQSKLRPTIDFILNVVCGTSDITALDENATCSDVNVNINPELFDLLKIDVVPAFVSPLYDVDLYGFNSNDDYKIIRGSVPFDYVLEKFNISEEDKK